MYMTHTLAIAKISMHFGWDNKKNLSLSICRKLQIHPLLNLIVTDTQKVTSHKLNPNQLRKQFKVQNHSEILCNEVINPWTDGMVRWECLKLVILCTQSYTPGQDKVRLIYTNNSTVTNFRSTNAAYNIFNNCICTSL